MINRNVKLKLNISYDLTLGAFEWSQGLRFASIWINYSDYLSLSFYKEDIPMLATHHKEFPQSSEAPTRCKCHTQIRKDFFASLTVFRNGLKWWNSMISLLPKFYYVTGNSNMYCPTSQQRIRWENRLRYIFYDNPLGYFTFEKQKKSKRRHRYKSSPKQSNCLYLHGKTTMKIANPYLLETVASLEHILSVFATRSLTLLFWQLIRIA